MPSNVCHKLTPERMKVREREMADETRRKMADRLRRHEENEAEEGRGLSAEKGGAVTRRRSSVHWAPPAAQSAGGSALANNGASFGQFENSR